ncbi:metallophosphoesterase [Catenovulum sp. 2E275]|uniref:metallophosphoesterase family protein n=1 Tax=Catenovulum sp. 2E275 TaxID=2980497 RepID=UPI0021D10DD8|nr:metallophosphoesterase [Catenovulum sp. 2E275]MCU4675265.1 metallophosphoesterase [Catenovulum sp. 2E275]
MKFFIKLLWLYCFFLSTNIGAVGLSINKIAFMPDVHFQDIYANLELPEQAIFEQPMLIRSMKAQMNSTRLFNEPYFAFISALDKLAEQGIKLVVLPGDFSDDGQPIHLQKLKQLFTDYEKRYGMRFYLAPGNHDPVKPWQSAHGKADFLNAKGEEFAIYSTQHSACKQKNTSKVGQVIYCDDRLSAYGYQGLLNTLGEFGFTPRNEDLYFETPFSNYSQANYQSQKGQQAALLTNRHFLFCDDQSQKNCMQMPDLSYLVEPVDGLWLLSIDANVYEPEILEQDLSLISQHKRSDLLKGSSYAGYNSVVKNKPFLISWIKNVVERARANNKVLIAFSHFPLGDFYDQASDFLAPFAGKDTYNQRRFPVESTLSTFAKTGLTVHFAGHMHINDSSVYKDKAGNSLFNIQAPSIAAYSPAYKILTIHSKELFEVESIALEQVAEFDKLFSIYQKEYQHLVKTDPNNIWQDDILSAKNYREFTEFHLVELVKNRILKQDWAQVEIDAFSELTGYDMVVSAFLPRKNYSAEYLLNLKKNQTDLSIWGQACKHADEWLSSHQQVKENWNWPFMQLINDYYRMASADELARRSDISHQQIKKYQILSGDLAIGSCPLTKIKLTDQNSFNQRVSCLILAMGQSIKSEPADHFFIDLKQSKLRRSPK